MIRFLKLQDDLMHLVARYMDMRMAHVLSQTSKAFRHYGFVLRVPLPLAPPPPSLLRLKLPGMAGAVGGVGRILDDRESEAKNPQNMMFLPPAAGFAFGNSGQGPRPLGSSHALEIAYREWRLATDVRFVRAVGPGGQEPLSVSDIQNLLQQDTHLHHLDLSGAHWLMEAAQVKPGSLLCDMLSKWKDSLRWLSLRGVDDENDDGPVRFGTLLCALAEYAAEMVHLRHLDLSSDDMAGSVFQLVWLTRILTEMPSLNSLVMDAAEKGTLLGDYRDCYKAFLQVRKRKADLDARLSDDSTPPSSPRHGDSMDVKQEEKEEKRELTGQWDWKAAGTVFNSDNDTFDPDAFDDHMWSLVHELSPNVEARLRAWVDNHKELDAQTAGLAYIKEEAQRFFRTNLNRLAEFKAAVADPVLQDAFLKTLSNVEHEFVVRSAFAYYEPGKKEASTLHWNMRLKDIILEAIIQHRPGWKRLALPMWASGMATSSGQFYGRVMRAHASTLQILQLDARRGALDTEDVDMGGWMDALHGEKKQKDKDKPMRTHYTVLPHLTDLTLKELRTTFQHASDLLASVPNLERLCVLGKANDDLFWALTTSKLPRLTDLHVDRVSLLNRTRLKETLESCSKLTRIWLSGIALLRADWMKGEDYVELLRVCSKRPVSDRPTHWFVDHQFALADFWLQLSGSQPSTDVLVGWREPMRRRTNAMLQEFRQWTNLRDLVLPMCIDLTEWRGGGGGGGGDAKSDATAGAVPRAWWPQLQSLTFHLMGGFSRLSKTVPLDREQDRLLTDALRTLVYLPPVAVLERFLTTVCPRNEAVQVRFVLDRRPLDQYRHRHKSPGIVNGLFERPLMNFSTVLWIWCLILAKLQLTLHKGPAKKMELVMVLDGQMHTPLHLWVQGLFALHVARSRLDEEFDTDNEQKVLLKVLHSHMDVMRPFAEAFNTRARALEDRYYDSFEERASYEETERAIVKLLDEQFKEAEAALESWLTQQPGPPLQLEVTGYGHGRR